MRILVVEDTPSVAKIVALVLERAGHEVVAACDGEEALALLRTGPLPGALVTDIEMPRMDGVALIAALRAEPRWGFLPIIVLSGHSDLDTVRRVAAMGIRHFVVKPVEPPQLLRTIMAATAIPEGVLDAQDAARGRLGVDAGQYDELLGMFRGLIERAISEIHRLLRGETGSCRGLDGLLGDLRASSASLGAARLARTLTRLAPQGGLDVTPPVAELRRLLVEFELLGQALASCSPPKPTPRA